ncbi:unnamed protein product [Adineta steineri]|uniref:Uncharacterized protein n=1 Tax=Adineta steineri TaxID=433720 RepID=A0A813XWK8_9BILA|nr:unnamed protein product [Adineta steineri]CAF0963953.1 unnamed protein product [Adineta steineri]
MASNDNGNDTMIISIRLIRSFEHRNMRNLVLRSIDSSGQMTGKELKQRILTMLPNENLPPPFKTFSFDTLKIEHYPHQSKSNDVVIRRDGDDRLIIEDDKHLCDYNIVEGTEIAFFKYSDYEVYKKNPAMTMD